MGDQQRSDKLVEHFIVAVKHASNGASIVSELHRCWSTQVLTFAMLATLLGPGQAEMQSCYPPGSREQQDFCRSVAMVRSLSCVDLDSSASPGE